MTDGGLRRPEDAPPLVHAEAVVGAVPRHVAIIMDGNRRWARERGIDELDGHAAGTEALRGVVTRAAELGVHHLTVYAFSRENWARGDREIERLFSLLATTIERETPELAQNGIRVDFLGRLDELPADAVKRINDACARTSGGGSMHLHVAFNYAGRTEIVDAVRGIVRSGIRADDIDEATFAAHLYTAGIPDPDLLVRTGGEERLSNFLLWQTAYAEIVTTPKLWPEFTPNDLDDAIQRYSERSRRLGR